MGGRATYWFGLAASLALLGQAAAQSNFAGAQAALDMNSLPTGMGINSPSPDPVPGGFTPAAVDPQHVDIRPQSPPRGGRDPHGNPLWAIPLKSLTATRERPIFVPSRRPPTPPAVAGPPPPPPARPPPPPPEPERPRLALVGAIASDTEGFAIFVDERTRDVLRLRTGDNHNGWVLRSVKGREATLQKDSETIQLALPAPSDPATQVPVGGGTPGFPGHPGNIGNFAGPGRNVPRPPGTPGVPPPPVPPRPPGQPEL